MLLLECKKVGNMKILAIVALIMFAAGCGSDEHNHNFPDKVKGE